MAYIEITLMGKRRGSYEAADRLSVGVKMSATTDAARMPAESLALTLRKPTARSRVTNGQEWLPNVDQRTAVARRYRDLIAQIASDQGGADRMSEARLQLVRRF